MSMYRCNECDSLVDDDHHPCEPDPRTSHELLCPGCFESLACHSCGSVFIGEDGGYKGSDYCSDCYQAKEEDAAEAKYEQMREREHLGE